MIFPPPPPRAKTGSLEIATMVAIAAVARDSFRKCFIKRSPTTKRVPRLRETFPHATATDALFLQLRMCDGGLAILQLEAAMVMVLAVDYKIVAEDLCWISDGSFACLP